MSAASPSSKSPRTALRDPLGARWPGAARDDAGVAARRRRGGCRVHLESVERRDRRIHGTHGPGRNRSRGPRPALHRQYRARRSARPPALQCAAAPGRRSGSGGHVPAKRPRPVRPCAHPPVPGVDRDRRSAVARRRRPAEPQQRRKRRRRRPRGRRRFLAGGRRWAQPRRYADDRDGVVAIQTSSVLAAGGPCVMDRISAGGRSVRSIALSPPWYDQDDSGQPRTRAAGELLLMVLEPATVQPGQTADSGGVLFAGTGLGLVPKGIVPIPPFDPAKEVAEPMRPLSLANPGGLFNEGAFLRAVKPKAAPEQPDLTACPTAPCTPLSIGQPAGAAPVLFPLLAAVSCSDGVTYFIDVANRRLVNQNKYAQANDVGILPLVNGTGPAFAGVGSAASTPPSLTLDATKFEPGVTRASSWRVIWHAAIPGLERRGGTITPVDSNTLRFTVALPNLSLFRDDPAIALAAGDVVSLAGYSIGTDNSPACQTVVSSESTPRRFELTIKDVQPDHLDLQVFPDNGATLGFHPQGCSAFGAVAEVRTARTQPWLVFDGNTIKGRVREDGTFDAHQPRFDYPRSTYGRTSTDVNPAPIASRDLAFSFLISGPFPDTSQEAGSRFTWSLSSGVLPVAYGNQLHTTAGLATAVYGYSSRRTQSLAFTSVTGLNEVLQADPFLLNSTTTVGLVAYR